MAKSSAGAMMTITPTFPCGCRRRTSAASSRCSGGSSLRRGIDRRNSMTPDPDKVSRLIADVAAAEIMPRFRKLESHHVIEKAAGDLVTIADRAAEERLTAALVGLLPGSTVVGEEAVAANGALLDRLNGDRPVWIIDPIDGTTNFIEGRTEFGVMVCLAQRGELVASWIHRPVTGATAMAEAGGGAWMEGARVQLRPAPAR